MSNYIGLFSFAVMCLASSSTAQACSPPATSADAPRYRSTVSSAAPAKDVPSGAVQLKVDAPDFATMGTRAFASEKITLRVQQVLNGKFSDPTVRLNITNVDQCESAFEPQFGSFFVTILPMEYSDGEPVLAQDGKQEFGSLFYKSYYPAQPDDKKTPQFAEYSPMSEIDLSFYDHVKLECLTKENSAFADWSAEAWRRCVGPGEYVALDCEQKKGGKLVCKENAVVLSNRPVELRRGYSFWVHHRTTIFSILLALGLVAGLGYFLRRRKLRTS